MIDLCHLVRDLQSLPVVPSEITEEKILEIVKAEPTYRDFQLGTYTILGEAHIDKLAKELMSLFKQSLPREDNLREDDICDLCGFRMKPKEIPFIEYSCLNPKCDNYLSQNIQKRQDKVFQIIKKKKSTRIDDVDISVRCFQSLKAVSITDIRQISNYTKKDLLATGFFVKRTITEIDELISPLGIGWKK
jgi:hypothetical protein